MRTIGAMILGALLFAVGVRVGAMQSAPQQATTPQTQTVTGPAHSGQSQEPTVDCSQGGRTQYEMNVCAGRDSDAVGEKLQALLDELWTTLTPQAWAELGRIQAQWEALLHRDCTWERGFFEGGSVAPMVYLNCVTTLTQARINHLKIFLCEGAGMTGPCEASRKY